MASGFFVAVLTVIFLQIGTGKDIKWIRNSNWDNEENWDLGRLPCKGDIASFSKVKPINGRTPIVYFNANSTFRSLYLPRNTKIVFKRSVTLRLSANESCEVDGNAVPVAAGVQVNNFIGVRENYWECKDNWLDVDNNPVNSAPCGNDVAVFPSDSTFSYVTSAANVSVKAILVRSQKLSNLDNYRKEFLLNLNIDAGCRDDTDKCLCIPEGDSCNTVPPNVGVSPSISVPNPFPTNTKTGPVNTGVGVNTSPGASRKKDGGSNAGAVAGAVIGVMVVLIIVAIIVVIVIIVVRKRRYIEPKSQRLEEDFPPAAKDSGTAAYDNPVYDIHTTDPMDQLVPKDELSFDNDAVNPLYQ